MLLGVCFGEKVVKSNASGSVSPVVDGASAGSELLAGAAAAESSDALFLSVVVAGGGGGGGGGGRDAMVAAADVDFLVVDFAGVVKDANGGLRGNGGGGRLLTEAMGVLEP